VAVTAAFLALAFLSTGTIRIVSLAASLICLGASIAVVFFQLTLRTSDSQGFSAELLNSTINEMREGLVVIDTDMRIVAANQAAQRLFANVESPIERRITEITRNPAIYDAFLDGVRGTERVGVTVETRDRDRRVFDLRVVPLRGSANGKITGALGVFFD